MKITIVSTIIDKEFEHRRFIWIDATRIQFKGDSLIVHTASGYMAIYARQDFISFEIN